jgi:D-amino-acid dehydrogenase
MAGTAYNRAMSKRDTDVLVLGGGVIGLSCAFYLLRAGRSVRVLERGGVGEATSHGNCGTLTPSHAAPLASSATLVKGLKWMLRPDAPLYIRPRADPALAAWLLRFSARCNRTDWWRSARAKGALLTRSRALIEQLVREEGLDCGFQASGLRYVYRDEKFFAADRDGLDDLRELGVESRLLDRAALGAAEPALREGMAGAIEFSDDAQLRPERYTAELARRVRELGGEIVESAAVETLEVERGAVTGARTAQGVERAREVLVALGPWSANFLAPHGIRLPIQPGKGYSQTYSPPALKPNMPLVLREHSVCVTAWDDGFRLGSTMEFSGYDASLNDRRLAALERGARDYLREPVGPQLRERWYGWRPMTYDDLPILGAAPRLSKLWLATGHGMMGMGMSAVTGEMLAALIAGQAPSLDPAPYAATRF